MLAVRAFVVFAIALAGVIAVAPTASAETARGCRGQLWIFVGDRQNAGEARELVASFEGRGTCKNRFHADDCRKRAADGIIRCARDMWATRNSGRLPPSCREERGDSFARVQLEGIMPGVFRAESILDRTRYAACCKFNHRAPQVVTNLWVQVTGDIGCISKHRTGVEAIQQGSTSPHAVDEHAVFQCAAVRSSGWCHGG